MEQICPKDLCTACAACVNVCPKDAIQMAEDGPLGYFYPQIDAARCIECKLCERTCPVNHPVTLHRPTAAFAAISKDMDDLMSSTSGAASSLLAQETLRQEGVVYGCGQNTYRDICHIRIDCIEKLRRIKGSKYAQSRIGTIYRSVKADLESGKKVMFSGVPCQIAGLRNYLRKDYENLLLVDLVCHGVPSQKLLRDNIEGMLSDHNITDKKLEVSFRRKGCRTSKLRYGIYLASEVDAVPIALGRDGERPRNNYIMAFLAGITFRENCFSCPYARHERDSDITIADFWGLQPCSVSPERGVSLLLINSPKGRDMIQAIRPKAIMEERPLNEAFRGNGQLNSPAHRPLERDILLKKYSDNPQLAYNESLKNYRKQLSRQLLYINIVDSIRRVPILGPIIHRSWKKIKNMKK